MRRTLAIVFALTISIIGIALVIFFSRSKTIGNLPIPQKNIPGISNQATNSSLPTDGYPVHKNITATTFWVGEDASPSNTFISNAQSAWDENWAKHFGGTDTPNDRVGFYPAGFTPKENPFYFALPYNDFDSNGDRKTEASAVVYWSKQNSWEQSQSMLKNSWVKITKNGKTAYAQWEDVGPYGEDDNDYVFGNSAPMTDRNNNVGIDLSPAMRDYLDLNGEEEVDWQFVNEKDVPEGPWKDIITTS